MLQTGVLPKHADADRTRTLSQGNINSNERELEDVRGSENMSVAGIAMIKSVFGGTVSNGRGNRDHDEAAGEGGEPF
jgi:hypothetical protein